MLVQALARKVEGLPITLLELNTIMHVVCALIMYLLWLKKPQDVGSPTLVYDVDKHKSKPLATLLRIRKVTHVPVPEKREKQRRPEDDLEYGLDASDTTLRWRNGVFEHKRGRPDTWVQQWHEPLALAPARVPTSMLAIENHNLEPQAAGKLRVSRLWIFQGNDTETYISFADGTFLTHDKALFLVHYSSEKIPTFGKSQASWQELCEEIKHNGGIGYAMKASNFQLDGSIESRGTKYAVWIAALLFPPIYGGVHLTP